jgi:nucleoid DNA-binding protein
MNKKDLVAELRKKGYTLKRSTTLVDKVFQAIGEGLVRDHKVELPFGTLEVRKGPKERRLWRLHRIVTTYRSKNRIVLKLKESE